MTGEGVERASKLKPELRAPAGVSRRGGGLIEVFGGRRPAERGLGGAQLGEHLGAQLRRGRLLERTLEIARGGLRGAGLASRRP